MRMTIVALATALALCPVVEARPKNPVRGWYVGLDAGSSQLDGDILDRDTDARVPFNDDSNSFTAHAGYRFSRFLQLGLFYADLGKFSESESGYTLDADLRAIGLQFTGRIPIGEKFGVLAQAAIMNRRLNVSARAANGDSESDYHGGLVGRWGLGVSYQFNPEWDIRLEHSHSSDVGDSFYIGFPYYAIDLKANLRTTTLGFRYKFPRNP